MGARPDRFYRSGARGARPSGLAAVERCCGPDASVLFVRPPRRLPGAKDADHTGRGPPPAVAPSARRPATATRRSSHGWSPLSVPDRERGRIRGFRPTNGQRPVGIAAARQKRATVQVKDCSFGGCARRANPFGGTVVEPYRFDVRRGAKAREQTRESIDTATDCGLWRW